MPPPLGEVSWLGDDGGGNFSGGSHPRLGCRLGSCAPVGRVQDRRSWQRRPVRGRAPPALAHPPPAPMLFERGGRAGAGGGIIFYILSFSKRVTAPFEPPDGRGSRGKIFLFGDGGAFGGKLLQLPKGGSCRGEGANTGSQAILSALCHGGLAVAAVFFGK